MTRPAATRAGRPRTLPRALRRPAEPTGRRTGPVVEPGISSPRRPQPTVEAPTSAPSRPARRRWGLVPLVALTVVLAAVTAWLGWLDHEAVATARARTGAVAAARSESARLFSYDYRTVDADLAAARGVVTGRLAKDYADTSRLVGPQATQNRAVVKAEVTASSVV
jgi:Mce-associated membrane protein